MLSGMCSFNFIIYHMSAGVCVYTNGIIKNYFVMNIKYIFTTAAHKNE